MMSRFIDKIKNSISYDADQVLGYSKEELAKIERLYKIKLVGDFRDFMLEMGRSDGGLVGDGPILLYRAGSVRDHMLSQISFCAEMREHGNFDHLGEKPFVFAVESEHLYSFLKTTSGNPDRVYSFDENTGTVKDTGQNFVEFMKETVSYYNQSSWEAFYKGKTISVPNNRLGVVCRGELIKK